jgi:hypothetical protein
MGEVTHTPNMRVALRLALVLLLCVAQPALAQPSHEVAIQETIVRSNAAQSLAVAARDLAAIADEADGAYYQRLLRGTQALLDDGATKVDLVNIEWGPISILGTTATATTVETWRTTYAAGPTEFARDRNQYSLALDEEGSWRIVSNSHPDGRPQFSSSPPADTDPQPDIDDEVEIPSGQSTSRNWSGYAARGEEFTSISGTWVVPEVGLETPFGADAAWVGIGGFRSRDLIQAGTQSISSGTGRVAYQAWYEKLPDYAHPVPLTILPGQTVNVSIDQQAPDTWLITLTNVTTGDVHRRTEEYQSSRTSAEWIQEAPFARRRVLPLSHFGKITFTSGSAVRGGQALTIADLGARAISLVDNRGRALAVPSPLGRDGSSFSVARSP